MFDTCINGAALGWLLPQKDIFEDFGITMTTLFENEP